MGYFQSYFERIVSFLVVAMAMFLIAAPIFFPIATPLTLLFLAMIFLGVTLLMSVGTMQTTPILPLHFYVVAIIVAALVVEWWFQYSWVFALFGDSFAADAGASLLMLLGFFALTYIGKPIPALYNVTLGLVIGSALLAMYILVSAFFDFSVPYMLSHVFMIGVGAILSATLLTESNGITRIVTVLSLVAICCFAVLFKEWIVFGAAVVSLGSVVLLEVIWARMQETGFSPRRVTPWVLAAMLVAGASAFFFLPHQEGRISDIRPSLLSSLQTLATEGNENRTALFFGVGPSGFARLWDDNRVGAANSMEQWGSEVPAGFNNFITFSGAFGFPLAVGFLLIVVYLAAFPLQFLIERMRDRRKHIMYALAIFLASAYACAYLLLYTLDIYALMCAGILFGLASRFYIHKVSYRGYHRIAVGGLALFFCVGGGAGVYATTTHEKGIALVAENPRSTAHAMSVLYSAHRVLPLPVFSRSIVAAHEKSADALIQDPLIDPSTGKDQALAELSLAVSYGNEAVKYGPASYQNYTTVARVFLLRGLLQESEEDFAQAATYYQYAGTLATRHPLPAFLEGQAYMLMGDTARAQEALIKAMRLRPNYTEAQALFARTQSP